MIGISYLVDIFIILVTRNLILYDYLNFVLLVHFRTGVRARLLLCYQITNYTEQKFLVLPRKNWDHNITINIPFRHQCSYVLLFGITRLRLPREQIENYLYIKQLYFNVTKTGPIKKREQRKNIHQL